MHYRIAETDTKKVTRISKATLERMMRKERVNPRGITWVEFAKDTWVPLEYVGFKGWSLVWYNYLQHETHTEQSVMELLNPQPAPAPKPKPTYKQEALCF